MLMKVIVVFYFLEIVNVFLKMFNFIDYEVDLKERKRNIIFNDGCIFIFKSIFLFDFCKCNKSYMLIFGKKRWGGER